MGPWPAGQPALSSPVLLLGKVNRSCLKVNDVMEEMRELGKIEDMEGYRSRDEGHERGGIIKDVKR